MVTSNRDDQPAKIEFVKRLAAKGIVWDGDLKKVPVRELRAFTDVLVEEYFKRTRAALREFDKGLLYLGCRFAGGVRPWVIKPCAKYCDVVSFNIYKMEILSRFMIGLHFLLKTIGESNGKKEQNTV